MPYLILITILGTNIAPFFLQKLNIWTAQTLWCQLMALSLTALSFWLRPKTDFISNKPVSVFFLWCIINTAFFFYTRSWPWGVFIHQFLAFFNVICIVLLYRAFCLYLNEEWIDRIIRWIKYSIVLTAILCVLQYYDLSQFFVMLFKNDDWRNNAVVGFIGQPTHLAGFLGMFYPLFMTRKIQDILMLVLLTIILLFFTGTTKGDPSATGVITAVSASLFYLWISEKRKLFWGLFSVVLIGGLVLFRVNPFFFYDHGRIPVLLEIWPVFQKFAITGHGLGFMNLLKLPWPMEGAKHVHMEYAQFALELGIIGLSLCFWIIKDFFDLKVKCKNGMMLKAMIVGFLVSACFVYPFHIWLCGIYIIFAYSALYVLRRENANIDKIAAS